MFCSFERKRSLELLSLSQITILPSATLFCRDFRPLSLLGERLDLQANGVLDLELCLVLTSLSKTSSDSDFLSSCLASTAGEDGLGSVMDLLNL